jgi:hypothetical protein
MGLPWSNETALVSPKARLENAAASYTAQALYVSFGSKGLWVVLRRGLGASARLLSWCTPYGRHIGADESDGGESHHGGFTMVHHLNGQFGAPAPRLHELLASNGIHVINVMLILLFTAYVCGPVEGDVFLSWSLSLLSKRWTKSCKQPFTAVATVQQKVLCQTLCTPATPE